MLLVEPVEVDEAVGLTYVDGGVKIACPVWPI